MGMWTDSARRQYRRLGSRYASDLTDEEFALIGPMLPAAKPGGRGRTTALREVLNAILYLLRTGCQWRMLPEGFPPRSTVYGYFRRFWQLGIWMRIWRALTMAAREPSGRKPRRVPRSSTARASGPRNPGGVEALMPARRCSAASAIGSPTRSACRSSWWFMPPTSRIEMAWPRSAAAFVAASPG